MKKKTITAPSIKLLCSNQLPKFHDQHKSPTVTLNLFETISNNVQFAVDNVSV